MGSERKMSRGFFLHDGRSGVATEESQQRLGKIKFIIFTGSRDRRQDTWKRYQCGQKAEDKSGGKVWARAFSWDVLRKW